VRRAPLVGTLEDMLRKASDTGMSLHRGPFTFERNLESGDGHCIPGTLNDEWRRDLGTGQLPLRGLHEVDLEGGLLYWGPQKVSKALEWASVSVGALLLENVEGCSFLRAFEIKRYIKRDVKMPCKRVSLSIGALLGNLEGIHLPRLIKRKG